MSLKTWWQGITGADTEITETANTTPAKLPDRTGFEYGVGTGGLSEWDQGLGASTGSDRRSMLTQLNDAYLACPWAWACINAIARTITAGGLVMEWEPTDGAEEEQPPKPPEVIALERMLAYCNPSESITKILRGVIADLEVFGDAYLEVVWVGTQPVALYSLDCPSMLPITDAHGQIIRYVQITELSQRAEFEPREVIHISLDSPRSSIFGVSPTQAAMLPITGYLFGAATAKEIFRKGNPPQIWADHPAGQSQAEMNRWTAQYMTRNVGPKNIGVPISTKGGATVKELSTSRTVDYIKYLDQRRDEILSCYGVPPAKVGVIESGNLGGGTGEEQDKTFRVNTCQPIAELVLEALNWHLARLGFGIEGWKIQFKDVDMRDSKTVEEIRDMRIRNGMWTLDRGRADIGEPPVEGGDQPVLIDRQNLVKWSDMDAASKAWIAGKLKGTALEPSDPVHGEPATVEKPAPTPVPPQLAAFAGKAPPGQPEHPPEPEKEPPPVESLHTRYRARLREALATLPGGVDERAA
ncbi:phage portal protein [Streptomyces sp. NPDC059340]|uniref:phage portal protein n=1 Tax=Streptomyces sp. NPDC059340 TaxID=3346806 RepID=UPI00367FCC8B